MTLINLTPHTLNIVKEDGSVLNVETSGVVCRISTTSEVIKTIEGINIFKTVFGQIEFKDKEGNEAHRFIPLTKGVIAIVSSLCLEACKKEFPFVQWAAPGELVRNEAGQPIGCKGLRFP